jgi:hypothetical protein
LEWEEAPAQAQKAQKAQKAQAVQRVHTKVDTLSDPQMAQKVQVAHTAQQVQKAMEDQGDERRVPEYLVETERVLLLKFHKDGLNEVLQVMRTLRGLQ